MKITSAKNLKYADETGKSIYAEVTIDVFGDEVVHFIGNDADNAPHIREFMSRIALGDFGVIAGYVHPVAPEKTPEQIQAELTSALDRHIDGVAKSRGYDSRITCAMRAGYLNPWQAECIAFGQWMDQCYVIGLTIANEVKQGTRPAPTVEELIAALPAMVWP